MNFAKSIIFKDPKVTLFTILFKSIILTSLSSLALA